MEPWSDNIRLNNLLASPDVTAGMQAGGLRHIAAAAKAPGRACRA